MIRFFTQVLTLSCVATVLTLLMGVGFAWQQGKLTQERFVKVAAVFHDVEFAPDKGKPAVSQPGDEEQASYLEQDQMRMSVSKNLDLKMQSLDNGLNGLAFARRKLENDATNFDRRLNSFEAELDEKLGAAKQEGRTTLRMIWEKMEPRRVKNHILKMVDEDQLEEVVVLLSVMQNDKRVKIINEFSTVDARELEVLSNILDKILRGDPEQTVIRETRDQLRDSGGAQNP